MKTQTRRPYPSPKRQRELFHRAYVNGWEVWGHEYDGGFCLYHDRLFVGLFVNCPNFHEAHRRALSYIVNLENGTIGSPDMYGRVLCGGIRLGI